MEHNAPSDEKRSHFIQAIIDADLASGKHSSVVTRFPPEPNGYPHIGHAKSICLNFGLAKQYGGVCHLRFDDTNPATEETEYVEAIQRDVRWLGFEWGENQFYASDYFQKLYDFGVHLIKKGKAYVCSLSDEEIRATRGSLTEPGTHSPYRDRSVEENLDLFAKMRAGDFKDGEHVLRGKIDMSAANMKMRDPLFFRIRHAHHYRTNDDWCIYPFYDFAHCLSDSIEGITHSICTLEFENNRELYDWIIAECDVDAVPRQYEFARLSLANTIMSKRKLLQLVKGNHVSGWDDPRMPTISGMRRRGYTPESIRDFCDLIGVAKNNSVVDFEKLEYSVRNDLNHRAKRVMGVLRPLKVTITNYPEDAEVDWLDADYWPHDVPKEGTRKIPFGRELFIERTDFMEVPARKYKRLAPGREVRLRYSYFLRCNEVVKDDNGEVVELLCTYDPETRGGNAPDGRKPSGTIHWVSASHSLPVEIRLYDRLFSAEKPGEGGRDFIEDINPDSVVVLSGRVEPSVGDDPAGTRYQFERNGYFITDSEDSAEGALVFNRIVGLKDAWAKQKSKAVPKAQKPPKAPKSATREDDRPQKRSRAYERQKLREQDPAIAALYQRFIDTHKLGEEEADLLSAEAAMGPFFEAAVGAFGKPAAVAKWIINELQGALGQREEGVSSLPFDGAAFGELVSLVDGKTINATIGKEILVEMIDKGGRPADIVKARGLEQVDDDAALSTLIDEVLAKHPDEAGRLKGGEKKLMGFFMGQVMRASGGRANAQRVRQLLQSK